jgi:trans-aconitate methyltransferase
MLALNRARVGGPNVRYLEADLFAWSPQERYDFVFFSAWLSHVPPQRFEDFWTLVAACLNDDGLVFVIDELPAVAAHEQPIADALKRQLAELGWDVVIRTVGWRFFYAAASRTELA